MLMLELQPRHKTLQVSVTQKVGTCFVSHLELERCTGSVLWEVTFLRSTGLGGCRITSRKWLFCLLEAMKWVWFNIGKQADIYVLY